MEMEFWKGINVSHLLCFINVLCVRIAFILMDTSGAKAMLFWENYANTIVVSDLATQWARESPAKVNNM